MKPLNLPQTEYSKYRKHYHECCIPSHHLKRLSGNRVVIREYDGDIKSWVIRLDNVWFSRVDEAFSALLLKFDSSVSQCVTTNTYEFNWFMSYLVE